MAAQKIYQAETELENARELRNWKELTDRLAKYAAKFPDRELVQSLYNAERVFDVSSSNPTHTHTATAPHQQTTATTTDAADNASAASSVAPK